MLAAQEVNVSGDAGASVSDVSGGASGKENNGEEDSIPGTPGGGPPAPFPYEATYRSLLAQSRMLVDMTEAICYNIVFAEGDGPDQWATVTRFEKSAHLNYFLVSFCHRQRFFCDVCTCTYARVTVLSTISHHLTISRSTTRSPQHRSASGPFMRTVVSTATSR
jgi:hypothetical protein